MELFSADGNFVSIERCRSISLGQFHWFFYRLVRQNGKHGPIIRSRKHWGTINQSQRSFPVMNMDVLGLLAQESHLFTQEYTKTINANGVIALLVLLSVINTM